jgi:hypothetical protein
VFFSLKILLPVNYYGIKYFLIHPTYHPTYHLIYAPHLPNVNRI